MISELLLDVMHLAYGLGRETVGLGLRTKRLQKQLKPKCVSNLSVLNGHEYLSTLSNETAWGRGRDQIWIN